MPEDNLEHVVLRETRGKMRASRQWRSAARGPFARKQKRVSGERKTRRRSGVGWRAGAHRDVRDVRLRRVARAPTRLLVLIDARRMVERLAFPRGGRRVHSTRGAQHRPSPHPSRRRERSSSFQFARELDARRARDAERHRSRARDATRTPHSPSHDTHVPRTQLRRREEVRAATRVPRFFSPPER
jgi:hypothetical protein